jgi:16S rRNA processing protein RimM
MLYAQESIATMTKTPYICIGRITTPHGLKGEVKLQSYLSNAEDIARYGMVYTAAQHPLGHLKNLHSVGKSLVGRLDSVETRTQAEALSGTELYIPKSAMPPLEDDAFYHAELIGLPVVNETGDAIGHIKALHDFGAGDIIEIAITDEKNTVFYPFSQMEIDSTAGKAIVQQEVLEMLR